MFLLGYHLKIICNVNVPTEIWLDKTIFFKKWMEDEILRNTFGNKFSAE